MSVRSSREADVSFWGATACANIWMATGNDMQHISYSIFFSIIAGSILLLNWREMKDE